MLSQINGLNMLAAAFSDIIARGQSQQLVSAINQAFAAQAAPVAAQAAGGPQQMADQVRTAYVLAVIDQMSRRREFPDVGAAIWWAMSGAGGNDLVRAMVNELAIFAARTGCSSPLRDALIREL